MFSTRFAICTALCFGPLAIDAVAASTAQYMITPIVVPGAIGTYPRAINAQGQVTGHAVLPDGATKTFVYTAGAFAYPDTLGARHSYANDISDGGDIVGTYYLPDDINRARAFAWIDGVMTDLGDLGSEFGAVANTIDKRGIVYGESGNAFAWRHGHLRDLGGFGDDRAPVMQVNATGVAVGYTVLYGHYTHAFMADRTGKTLLPTLGGESAAAKGINDDGVVCGWAEVPSGKFHAFRFQGGVIADLGTLPGGVHSEAFAINRAGDIVGQGGSTKGPRAVFVRAGGTVMEDLNTLADAKAQGWRLEAALDINDQGEIVGHGNRGGFVLRPVGLVRAAGD